MTLKDPIDSLVKKIEIYIYDKNRSQRSNIRR